MDLVVNMPIKSNVKAMRAKIIIEYARLWRQRIREQQALPAGRRGKLIKESVPRPTIGQAITMVINLCLPGGHFTTPAFKASLAKCFVDVGCFPKIPKPNTPIDEWEFNEVNYEEDGGGQQLFFDVKYAVGSLQQGDEVDNEPMFADSDDDSLEDEVGEGADADSDDDRVSDGGVSDSDSDDDEPEEDSDDDDDDA